MGAGQGDHEDGECPSRRLCEGHQGNLERPPLPHRLPLPACLPVILFFLKHTRPHSHMSMHGCTHMHINMRASTSVHTYTYACVRPHTQLACIQVYTYMHRCNAHTARMHTNASCADSCTQMHVRTVGSAVLRFQISTSWNPQGTFQDWTTSCKHKDPPLLFLTARPHTRCGHSMALPGALRMKKNGVCRG